MRIITLTFRKANTLMLGLSATLAAAIVAIGSSGAGAATIGARMWR